MAKNRVTLQDIAAACGLSRNTVSKVFNSRGTVPESTRQQVLTKAREMGYFSMLETEPVDVAANSAPRSIAVFSRSNSLNHNFALLFLKGFTDTVCRMGYVVQMYELCEEELKGLQLPQKLALDNTVGILGIELFDKGYIHYLCGLGIPTIMADCYYGVQQTMLPCDVISMENYASTKVITEQTIDAGAKTLGFVGDIHHCNSFYERWGGFCTALRTHGIKVDRQVCIHEKDGAQYSDVKWLEEHLRNMPSLPYVFLKDRYSNEFPCSNLCGECTNVIYNSVPVFISEKDGIPYDFQDFINDAHSGTVAFHYWSEQDMSFRIQQTVYGLELGKYQASVWSQGGDMTDASMVLYVIADGQYYEAPFMNTAWADWQHPVIDNIPVTQGSLVVGVKIQCGSRSWGTLDDFSVIRK